MPEHDEFDERLAQRLRAYESRIPDGEIPMTESRSTRSSRSPVAAGGVIAVGALAGVLLALGLLNRPTEEIGHESPSPTASVQATPNRQRPPPRRARAPAAIRRPRLRAGRGVTARSCSANQGSATVVTSGPGGRGDSRLRREWTRRHGTAPTVGTWQLASFTAAPGIVGHAADGRRCVGSGVRGRHGAAASASARGRRALVLRRWARTGATHR